MSTSTAPPPPPALRSRAATTAPTRRERAARRAATSPRAPLSRRYLWLRARRVLVLALLASAFLVMVRAVAPPPPARVPAVVTTRDVPAGTVLRTQDVTLDEVPVDGAPPEVLTSVEDAVGRPTAVRAPSGTALTEATTVGPRFTDQAPPGTLVVALPLASPAQAPLATPGSRVQLLAAPPTGDAAERVGSGLVLATLGGDGALGAGEGPLAGMTSPTSGASGPVTYVAVTPDVAMVLTGADASGRLTIAAGG